MPHLSSPRTQLPEPPTQSQEARILAHWLTGIRRSGLLSSMTPDAWHTLCAVLSFLGRDGRCFFSLDQLALTLCVPRETATQRLAALADLLWQGQRLLQLEIDPSGAVTGATLAPLELLVRLVPPSSSGDAPDEDTVNSDLEARLLAVGLNRGQARGLLAHYPADRIEQQLHWLPERHPNNPAALLLRAVEGDWAPPREAE